LKKKIAYVEFEKFSENRRMIEADRADEELKDTVLNKVLNLTEGKRGKANENKI